MNKKNKTVSYDELHSLFHYDPLTGLLHRKKNGKTVGTLSNGYLLVSIKGKSYQVHRIAYCMHHGYWPENDIDHINRRPWDNRIENIREVTCSCNMRNCGNLKSNTSGVKGVNRDSRNKRWHASITVNKKTIFLGSYRRFEDAVRARYFAECELSWNICDSNSPAKQYLDNLN